MRRALAGLIALAAIEVVCAASAYRETIDADDWTAANDATKEIESPVVVAPSWLEPRARMEVAAVADLSAVARPDLRGLAELYVLGLGSASWSADLDADLDGRPRPKLEAEIDAGALTLYRYRFDAPEVTTGSFLGAPRLEVEARGKACRGRGQWNCDGAVVSPMTAEIDFRPRRCVAVPIDQIPVTLRYPRMPTGSALVGHVGFHDFNGRLRSDAPATLSVDVDGAVAMHLVVTDAQGWRAFEIPVEPQTHDVTVTVVSTAGGTWGRAGYDGSATRQLCFELRGVQGVAG